MGVAVQERGTKGKLRENPRREPGVAARDDYIPGEYFVPVPGAKYRFDYDRLLWDLDHDERVTTPEGAAEKLRVIQWYCLNDLFFLGYFALEITILNES